MDIGPERQMDLVRALGAVDIGSRTDVHNAARAVLVSRKEDLLLFDAAFDRFWAAHTEMPKKSFVSVSGELPPQANPIFLPPSPDTRSKNERRPDDNPENQPPPVIEVTATYSDRAVLREKDFAEMTPEELYEVKHLMADFVWRLGERRTRRFRRGGDDRLDMRRTVRRNLRYGGEIIRWAHRQPAFKPRPLILVADISGSMDRYTRLLLRFCYSVAHSFKQPVEAFVFGTELTRVTRQLRLRDVDRALDDIGKLVPDWSGGTRIGEAIKTFNFQWSQRVLGRGAVVVLISDGWDTGNVDVLSREMARLSRCCSRLIWLNPLMGSASYEPIASGMQAALPHIDDFLPVHNLASLEGLADRLATLGPRSEVRRPYARRSA
jgi:uncharacterized protein with von Willebrand factor type A (vWA) domain